MEFFIATETNPNLVLDVKNQSKEKGATIILNNNTGNKSQKWIIQGKTIINSNSGLVLDIKGIIGAKF